MYYMYVAIVQHSQQTPNWHRQLELINLNCSVLHAFPNWCLCCPVSCYCVEMLGCLN